LMRMGNALTEPDRREAEANLLPSGG
jgi:hypothetical protein